MVKVIDVHSRETFESERVSKLMEIVRKTVPIRSRWMSARGEHINVGLSVSTGTMDIYYNENKIDVYSPDWENIGKKVAEAFESAGESEFTVRRNYDPEFYRR